MKKIAYIFLFLLFLFPTFIYAQDSVESFKGTVEEIFEVPCSEIFEEDNLCFEYLVKIKEREESIRTISSMVDGDESKFVIGDKVYVAYSTDDFESESWSITGFVREGSILTILIIFAVVAILVGRRQGLGSLISLGITVFLLYMWAIPKILNGGDVIFIGVVTVCISLVSIMYISHGFSMKSNISVFSTLVGIVIVAILAKLFIGMVRIDGSGSEEAFLLFSQTGGNIDLSAVFFVSILIGAMGVLDDVVMSQVSAIKELYIANPTLSRTKLFSQSMNIGRDHLSSMVNTLFIAYAGSSFALVMLLTYNSGGIGNILQADVIAEEIVRTLSASIGILLIVPITSFVAAHLISLDRAKS